MFDLIFEHLSCEQTLRENGLWNLEDFNPEEEKEEKPKIDIEY